MSSYYCIRLPDSEFKPCDQRVDRYGQKEISCIKRGACAHSGYVKLDVKDHGNYLNSLEKLRAQMVNVSGRG